MGIRPVRILIAVSGYPLAHKPETCKGIRHVQTYYLSKYLREMGHEVVYVTVGIGTMNLVESRDYYLDSGAYDVPEADHCLCLEPRGFHKRTPEGEERNVNPNAPPKVWKRYGECPFYDAIRAKVPGCIATLCDMPRALGCEDITFYGIRHPADYPLHEQTRELGWAADGEMLKAEQPYQAGPINVLLDHGHYNKKEDHSDMLLESLAKRPEQIRVKRFAPGGVEDVDLANWTPVDQRPPGATYAEAVDAHNWAHVFCVTHQESLGLSVLEAAMAGNLIVLQKGFIKPVLVNPLRRQVYDSKQGYLPDWTNIFRNIDPPYCRSFAERFNRWREMAAIVANTFEGWKR